MDNILEIQNEKKTQIIKDTYIEELEGIVSNEPKYNKYETVKFHKLNVFPYFLIGKVVSKFNFDGVSKYLNGVGILVGPNIVLTVAHNLCHMVSKEKILMSKKICFFPAANGDFSLFEPSKSAKYHVPESYLNALKTDDREQQLYNDWGLVFLNSDVGDHIVELLDIEKTANLQTNKGLYNFFENNENLNLHSIAKQTKSEKISIVGYTEFKDNCRNNAAYKFANNFVKKIDEHEENDIKSKMNKKSNNNILQDLGCKDKEMTNINDKKININININTTAQESVTEGLITSSRYYPKKNSEIRNQTNGIDYIILGNEDYNREFDTNDKEKLIMCESQGNLKELDQENVNKHEHQAIKYQISTYKGQSGSPLFLRIKRISEKDGNNAKAKPVYIYQFIGLHSRRGPTTGEEKFYESEKMNNLTENIMSANINDMPIRNSKLLYLGNNKEQTNNKYEDNENMFLCFFINLNFSFVHL